MYTSLLVLYVWCVFLAILFGARFAIAQQAYEQKKKHAQLKPKRA